MRPSGPLAVALASAALAFFALAAPAAATSPIEWDLAVNYGPLYPTSADRLRIVVRGDMTPGCVALTFAPPVVEGTTIRLQGRRVGPSFECTPTPWWEELVLPPLPSDGQVPVEYHLEVWDEDLLIHREAVEVLAPVQRLGLGDGIVVSVRLVDPRAGAPRDATAVQLTPQSGYFWFFDPDNVEVTAKVVDGTASNGHTWVFVSGMTNLAVEVTVEDTNGCAPGSCPRRTWRTRPGRRVSIIDTTTF